MSGWLGRRTCYHRCYLPRPNQAQQEALRPRSPCRPTPRRCFSGRHTVGQFGHHAGRRALRAGQVEATVSIVGSVSVGVLVARRGGRGADSSMPHLRRQGTATQLIVDGEAVPDPRRRDSATPPRRTPTYLRPFWAKFAELNLNTVLAARLLGPDRARGGPLRLLHRRPADRRRARQRDAARAALVRLVEEQHVVLRAGLGEARPAALPARDRPRRHAAGDPVAVLGREP